MLGARAPAQGHPQQAPAQHIEAVELGLPRELGQAVFLGRGAFSKVWHCQRVNERGEAEDIAVKVVETLLASCNSDDLDKLGREVYNQSALDHPCICKLLDVGLTERATAPANNGTDAAIGGRMYLVLQYASGGTLAAHVDSKGGRLLEARAKWYFLQLVSGLRHCHAYKVYNRDVKPANCLLHGNDELMIGDFGLSKCRHTQGELSSNVGTLVYQAPEVMDEKLRDANGSYDGAKVDVYSAGVTLYEMAIGGLPYYFLPSDLNTPLDERRVDHRRQFLTNKAEGRWWPAQRPWPSHVSADLRDLLDGMLCVEPQKRLSMAQVLAHPWTRRDVQDRVLERLDNEPAEVTYADLKLADERSTHVHKQFTQLRNMWRQLRSAR